MDFEMFLFCGSCSLEGLLFSVNLSSWVIFFFPMTLKASGLEFAYDPVINNTEFFQGFFPLTIYLHYFF